MKEISSTETKLTVKQQSMLKLAVNLAQESTCKQRHGAVVVKGGRVISLGVNRYRNSPYDFQDNFEYSNERYSDPRNTIGVHAEIAAINKLDPAVLRGSIVYVGRIAPSGRVSNSKPCDMCGPALKAAGVKRVIYTG